MTKGKFKKNGIQRARRDYNKNDDPRKPFWNEKGYWNAQGVYRSGIAKEDRKRQRCGAKTKSGKPCARWAMKNGRCQTHGGKQVTKYYERGADSVGDKETIWHDVITEDEAVFVSELKLEAEIMLNEELKLITIRERRMMERINNLSTKEFTIVQKSKETEIGTAAGQEVDKVKNTEVAKSTLEQVQAIEEALTKVQEKKARLIELKLKVQGTDDDDNGSLDGLVKVLEDSRKRLKKEKEKSDKQLGVD